MAEVLAKQPRPKGPRLTIVTNAGGPGVLATDALIDGGGELAPPGAETIEALERILPPPGATTTRSTSWATPTPDRYAKALEIAANDPNSDGLLVDPHPAGHDRPDPDRRAAQGATPRSTASRCWRAGWAAAEVAAGEAILQQRRHPHLPLPRHRRPALHTTCGGTADNLHGLYETPILPADDDDATDRAARRRR